MNELNKNILWTSGRVALGFFNILWVLALLILLLISQGATGGVALSIPVFLASGIGYLFAWRWSRTIFLYSMPFLIVIAAVLNVWMSFGLEKSNAFYTPPGVHLAIIAILLAIPYLINYIFLTRQPIKAQFNSKTRVTKKLLTSLIVSAVLVTLIIGYSIVLFLDLGRPYIYVINSNEEPLTNVMIIVGGNEIEISEVPAGDLVAVDINEPFGESEVQMSYELDGARVEWRGGNIEGSGGYLADLIVESDGSVNFIPTF